MINIKDRKAPRGLWLLTEYENDILEEMVADSKFFNKSKVNDFGHELIRELIRLFFSARIALLIVN